MSKDIIRWVIDCMMRHDDSITESLALTVERESRAEWGGQRVEYIAHTCDRRPGDPRALPAENQRRAYEDALRSTDPLPAVAGRHGMSRATLYRLLKKGPPPGT